MTVTILYCYLRIDARHINICSTCDPQRLQVLLHTTYLHVYLSPTPDIMQTKVGPDVALLVHAQTIPEICSDGGTLRWFMSNERLLRVYVICDNFCHIVFQHVLVLLFCILAADLICAHSAAVGRSDNHIITLHIASDCKVNTPFPTYSTVQSKHIILLRIVPHKKQNKHTSTGYVQ